MILSSALLGARQVYMRYLVQTVDPVRTVVWQMAWSVPLFLLFELSIWLSSFMEKRWGLTDTTSRWSTEE